MFLHHLRVYSPKFERFCSIVTALLKVPRSQTYSTSKPNWSKLAKKCIGLRLSKKSVHQLGTIAVVPCPLLPKCGCQTCTTFLPTLSSDDNVVIFGHVIPPKKSVFIGIISFDMSVDVISQQTCRLQWHVVDFRDMLSKSTIFLSLSSVVFSIFWMTFFGDTSVVPKILLEVSALFVRNIGILVVSPWHSQTRCCSFLVGATQPCPQRVKKVG